ncbi:MAG: acyltransferase [Gammaproteobacteria bacterium]|nr:acyltransferase [Gammaproteobacteria bacterium]
MLQSRYLTEEDLADFGFKALGRNVRISSDARIYGPENISIGNNVRIDDFTILAAIGGWITLGDYVFLARNTHLSAALGIEMRDFSGTAGNVIIYSSSDDYSGESLTAQAVPKEYTRQTGGPVIVGRHVLLGAATTVIGPCDIGEGCSVGSMSLVRDDLPPWGIYAGIPARRLKERSRKLLALETRLVRQKGG